MQREPVPNHSTNRAGYILPALRNLRLDLATDTGKRAAGGEAMTQLTIADWTTTTESQWNHAHAVSARPKATGRMTCKCRLCGKRWTAKRDDMEASFARHGESCTRYQAVLKRWTAGATDEVSARWNLANSYMERREIIGTFKAGVKCDARCQGAIGHDCECSCGGVNHGIGFGI